MMNGVAFEQVIAGMGQMTLTQLEMLENEAVQLQEEKHRRFDELCVRLMDTLEKLYEEFPNCSVYLTHTPTEDVDLMDLILPKNFLEKCKIGD